MENLTPFKTFGFREIMISREVSMQKIFSIMLLALLAVGCAHVREPASTPEEQQLERFEFYRLQMGSDM